MIIFEYEHNTDLIVVWIQYGHCNRNVHCNITEEVGKDIIPVFIKAAVLHYVGIYLLIQRKYQIKYDVDAARNNWSEDGPCYNTKKCPSLYGTDFEYFFVNVC